MVFIETNETGVTPKSTIYFLTPSRVAKDYFYYITRCGHYFCDCSYSFSGESPLGKDINRKTILLFYIKKGKMAFRIDGKEQIANGSQIVLIDCLLPHEYRALEDSEFLWLHLDGVNTRTFYEGITLEQGQIFTAVKSNSFYLELCDLINSCNSTVGVPEVHRSQEIYKLLCSLLMPYIATDFREEVNSPIGVALNFIEESLEMELSVALVAGKIGMSASHFSRKFRSEVGYSPHEYIMLRRIDKAQWLLYNSSLSISEIGYQVGYHSQSNFIHAFQNKVGVSPARFRKLTLARHPLKFN